VALPDRPAIAAAAKPVMTPASAPVSRRAEIPLESDGGTFRIPVTINDAIALKFTIDSGASDVTIPSDVASTLVRAGTISADDYIGSQTFVLADGSQVPSPEFRIRSLRVGNVVLHNIVASITGTSGSLLLGQSFLRRLKSWSIDNGGHVLRLEATPNDDLGSVNAAPRTAVIAAGSPSIARPDRITSAGSLEASAEDSVLQFYAAWSDPTDPDGQSVRPYFAPSINFYGKQLYLDDLMAGEINRFARRWPIRTYKVRTDSMQTRCLSETRVCTVIGLVDWSAANGDRSRTSSGTASFSLALSNGQIIREYGKVLSRTASSQPNP
jgi:clan AA aspartic protease (TIGR02281 family)